MTMVRRGAPTKPSTGHDATVLADVKGALAALGGCAALDVACAPCRAAFVDGFANQREPPTKSGGG